MKKDSKNRARQPKGLKPFIGGSILTDERVTRQLPFFFFIVFLGMMLITNRYWSEKTLRELEVVQDSIKDLNSQSAIYSAELMDASLPSEVVNRVKEAGLGLDEPKKPPQKIAVKKVRD